MFLATVFAILTVLWINGSSETPAEYSTIGLIPLTLASAVIVLVGLLDDRFSLRGRQKLAGQLIAVGIVIGRRTADRTGVYLGLDHRTGIAGACRSRSFGCSVPINALNLLDGADGFATCIGHRHRRGAGWDRLDSRRPQSALMAMALTGALLGFLAFNFPPSSIFLGDAGSMLIGLVVGVLTGRRSDEGSGRDCAGHARGAAADPDPRFLGRRGAAAGWETRSFPRPTVTICTMCCTGKASVPAGCCWWYRCCARLRRPER